MRRRKKKLVIFLRTKREGIGVMRRGGWHLFGEKAAFRGRQEKGEPGVSWFSEGGKISGGKEEGSSLHLRLGEKKPTSEGKKVPAVIIFWRTPQKNTPPGGGKVCF